MNKGFIVIIPARMQSTRLANKMTLDIQGLPLIVRTANQALKSNAKEVLVATDDKQIEAICKAYNINVIITKDTHQTGTDRIAEAVSILNYKNDEVIINVQGDEPLIPPKIIDNLSDFIIKQQAKVATIAHKIYTEHEIFNPSIVKVTLNKNNHAMYFSRAPIPYFRDGFAEKLNFSLPNGINFLRHIGIYAYSVEFLKNYNKMSDAIIEHVEKLEQLRILYHAESISVMVSDIIPEGGIDTIEDLQRVKQVIAQI